ncbi:MAG: pyrroloquinoline quinone precursor peptide PqqA [Pseudomonadota bacterium]
MLSPENAKPKRADQDAAGPLRPQREGARDAGADAAKRPWSPPRAAELRAGMEINMYFPAE